MISITEKSIYLQLNQMINIPENFGFKYVLEHQKDEQQNCVNILFNNNIYMNANL